MATKIFASNQFDTQYDEFTAIVDSKNKIINEICNVLSDASLMPNDPEFKDKLAERVIETIEVIYDPQIIIAVKRLNSAVESEMF